MGQQLARVRHHRLEEAVFVRGEVDEIVSEPNEPAGEIDLEVAEAQVRLRAEVGVRAAERGSHPGEELLDVERLRHVVVRAGVEGLDLVGASPRGRTGR